MPQIQLTTNTRYFTKGYGTAPTQAGGDTTPPVIRTASPSALDGVIPCRNANLAKLVFYGTNAADEIYDALVYQWTQTKTLSTTDVWVPTLVAQFTVTLGTCIGVSAKDPAAPALFADTIVFVDGDESVKVVDVPTAAAPGPHIASVTLDLEGAEYFQVGIDFPGSGQAASANFLVALF